MDGKVVCIMLYKFASFPDGTEISYSEILKDENGTNTLPIFSVADHLRHIKNLGGMLFEAAKEEELTCPRC